MAKHNQFIAKMRAQENQTALAYGRVTEQFLTDTLEIAMAREFGFGYDRLCRLLEVWTAVQREYNEAIDPLMPEADYNQELMDREIRQIIDGRQELMPFAKRYPELRKCNYKGRMK